MRNESRSWPDRKTMSDGPVFQGDQEVFRLLPGEGRWIRWVDRAGHLSEKHSNVSHFGKLARLTDEFDHGKSVSADINF